MPKAVFTTAKPHATFSNRDDRVVFSRSSFATASPSIKTIPGAKGKDGSGFGWIYLTDSEFSAVSPQIISAGQRVQLKNNGVNGINNLKLQFENHNFLAENRIRSLKERDSYSIRLDFFVMSEAINNEIVLEVDIAGQVGTIQSEFINLGQDAGTPKLITVNLLVYALDTFLANGAGIFVTPNSNINIYKAAFFIRPEESDADIL